MSETFFTPAVENASTFSQTTGQALIAANFVEPDAAARAIGALEDHGIHARQISVATPATHTSDRITTGIAQDGENTDVTVSSKTAHSPSVFRDADGFLEVQTDDPPTPTDMNAVSEGRRGSSSTLTTPDNPIAAEGERALTTTTPEDALRGAAAGGLAGLGLGLLAGAAALMIPGVGPVLAIGPLWMALAGTAGTAAAGVVTGGVVGYLRDMGMPSTVADHHADGLTRGSVVVTVHLDSHNNPQTVSGLLQKYGGLDVHSCPSA